MISRIGRFVRNSQQSLDRLLDAAFPRPFLQPGFIHSSFPHPALTPTATETSFIEQIPILLMAVPKRKVSYYRKRLRNATKFPKNKQNIHVCIRCGKEKLLHHYCLEADCGTPPSRAPKTELNPLN